VSTAEGPTPLRTGSPEETIEAGARIGADLMARFPQGTLVLLVGPLGAGKTVLAKGIARAMGIAEPVVSPTYTIISEYAAGAGPLYHVDLYRIEGRSQMENLGIEDLIAGPGFVLVEWGEKLEDALPVRRSGCVRVTISIAENGGRDILIEGLAA
jgi:tRNA threonylcarbamoyladenosine biosynthesis protein TsaE